LLRSALATASVTITAEPVRSGTISSKMNLAGSLVLAEGVRLLHATPLATVIWRASGVLVGAVVMAGMAGVGDGG